MDVVGKMEKYNPSRSSGLVVTTGLESLEIVSPRNSVVWANKINISLELVFKISKYQ